MNERFLIFVPMYNCEAQIPRVIEQMTRLYGLPIDPTLVCIDNGSNDGTLSAAERALDKSSVAEKFLMRNDGNYNLGGSHKVAFDFARKLEIDYVIVLHGDDQGSIEDILPEIQNGNHRNYDALLGARFMRGAILQGYSPLRTYANRAFNLLFSAIARRRFYDLGSGLNLFRRAIFDDGFHLRYADDLTFNYYLIFGLADNDRRVRFFPIHWREDDQVSNAKLFSQGRRMLNLLRQRLQSKTRFHKAEHRTTPRNNYPSTIVREWHKAESIDS